MWKYKEMAHEQAYALNALFAKGDFLAFQKELDILRNEPQEKFTIQTLIYALRGGLDDLAMHLFGVVHPSTISYGTTLTHHAVHGNCSHDLPPFSGPLAT